MGKSFYRVASPIRFEGEDREIGEIVEMDDDLAASQGSRLTSADEPVFDPDGEVITKAKMEAMGEDYVARVKGDLAECQRLRDEAANDKAAANDKLIEAAKALDVANAALGEAQKLRDDAARDLETAKELRSKADEDRKAAEDALAKVEKLSAEKPAKVTTKK